MSAKKYSVLITGTAFTEVLAANAKEAEEIARKKIVNERFGIWDMDMAFVCDEHDLIEETEA